MGDPDRRMSSSTLRSAFLDQFGHCVPLRCELPPRSEQSARQLAAIRDDADRDLLFAFHRLPVLWVF